MRILAILGAALTTTAISSAALAWDGPDLWYGKADAAMPGGGGILGTGGQLDRNITCAHCHTKAQSQIDVKFDFTPPLPTTGGQSTYAPGQTYQVKVQLVGEHLGKSGCGQYLTHVNNFAATFKDAGGKLAGVLTSDSGQTSTSCPQVMPKPINGTTVLYGDCHGITAAGGENLAQWSFVWKAPASGSGPLTLFYGAVDGDCDMTSMGDDVKVGNIKLGEASASLAPPGGRGRNAGSRWAMALFGVLPIGVVIALRGRRRRRA